MGGGAAGEGLYGLYCSPGTVSVMQVKWMGWAGHVARMVKIAIAYGVAWSRLETGEG